MITPMGAPGAGAIGLLGDVMLGRGVGDALRDGARPEDVWAPELRELAASCDTVVCNLECCVSSGGHRTERQPGKPFFFRAPPAAIESLRSVGVAVVGLANNHALDYEVDALGDTLDALGAAGVAVTGAGPDLNAARRGAVVRTGGGRVGIVAVSDHPAEFEAGESAAGIAYADIRSGIPEWLVEELGRLRAECDLVIAFPHWGPNMTTEPSASRLHAAEQLQDAGADLVAGHSAHVFHGVGWGPRGPIAYDLGDALDDYRVDAELRNDLGLMALWRPGDGGGDLELVGLALELCRTRLAAGVEAEWIATRLERACEPLDTAVERVDDQRFRISPR